MSAAWRLLLGLALASASGPGAAQAETVRSKVPPAQVDAFLKDCTSQLPNATCQCIVKTLSSTREGDFILDVAGSQTLMKSASEAERKSNGLAILNRHGMKASEAVAIAEGPLKSLLDNAARTCA